LSLKEARPAAEEVSNECLRVLSLRMASSIKEGGASAERKGKVKMEDLKVNTVFKMLCERKRTTKSTDKRSCTLIKEHANATHQRVQGNYRAPQAKAKTLRINKSKCKRRRQQTPMTRQDNEGHRQYCAACPGGGKRALTARITPSVRLI
jgi:hypothetical protein